MLGAIGGLVGGGKAGGLLGGLLGKMNPLKMLKDLMELPKQLLGGLGNPLEMLQKLDPSSLLQGLGGAAKERGL